MMVVDSSALVAIPLREADADRLATCLGATSSPIMSAVSLLESGMVAKGRLGEPGLDQLHHLIAAFSIRVIPFDQEQADRASYALAASHSLPLLYKGADFANTDMQTALPA